MQRLRLSAITYLSLAAFLIATIAPRLPLGHKHCCFKVSTDLHSSEAHDDERLLGERGGGCPPGLHRGGAPPPPPGD